MTDGADPTPAQARYRDEAAQFGEWAVYFLRLRLGGQNSVDEAVRNVWYAAHFGNCALGAQQIDDADGLALVGLDPLKRIAAFLRIYAARIRKNERWDVRQTVLGGVGLVLVAALTWQALEFAYQFGRLSQRIECLPGRPSTEPRP